MLSLDVKRTNLNAKTFGGTDRLKAINIWKSVEPGENPGGISWKRNRSRCLSAESVEEMCSPARQIKTIVWAGVQTRLVTDGIPDP